MGTRQGAVSPELGFWFGSRTDNPFLRLCDVHMVLLFYERLLTLSPSCTAILPVCLSQFSCFRQAARKPAATNCCA
jgi:hypothetical protein